HELLFVFFRRVAVAGRRPSALAGLTRRALGLSAAYAPHVRPLVALFERHHAHALRVAADHRDAAHRHADDLALARDHHQLLAVDDFLHADHVAVSLRGLDRDDAEAAAVAHAALADLRALAEAVLGDREQRAFAPHRDQRDHLVGILERGRLHAVGPAAHGSRLALAA